jgi:hypothetical protein
MKKRDNLLLILSAAVYALPFIFSSYLWWLVFIFPLPLFYLASTNSLSFVQGYCWGLMIFSLHLHAGIIIIAHLAGNYWWVGVMMGFCMICYQALACGVLFWIACVVMKLFSITSVFIRVLWWSGALSCLFFWIDRYCMWIFGISEGYPLMFPLVPLMHYPSLLGGLQFVGKSVLLLFFFWMPASVVCAVSYKNYLSFLFCFMSLIPWIAGGLYYRVSYMSQSEWHKEIKTLPYMIRSTHNDAVVAMKMVARHIKKLLAIYSEATIIIMPESALPMMHNDDIVSALSVLDEQSLGKKIHIFFGMCRHHEGNYYNSLCWVHNGVLQAYFDKKHAMLMTERLADWMDNHWLQAIYFKDAISITRSDNDRPLLSLSESINFVPYICSELFFTEYPDDCHRIPIMALINDTLLIGSYLEELLVLLARFKAIQWQRDIFYSSYKRILFIDKCGIINHVT